MARSRAFERRCSTRSPPRSPIRHASLAAELGKWHHDDLAGDDPDVVGRRRHRRARPLPQRRRRRRTIGWEEVFWLPGAAAGDNPALSAQLAAARRGVDLASDHAVSETGEARIASFPMGSDLASHQTDGRAPPVPRRMAAASAARHRPLGAQPPARSPGRRRAWCSSAASRLPSTAADGSGRPRPRRVHRPRLHWIDGRAFSASIAAFAAGGHLLIASTSWQTEIVGVDVDWAFRTWPIDGDDRR